MLGQTRFANYNAPLSNKLAEKGCLIAAHRGSWGGNIIQNTNDAYDTALKMGADMVEADVVSTLDGVLYSFHDENEERLLGVDRSIRQMTSREVDSCHPVNAINGLCSRRINRLTEILEHLNHGELLNIDRAWDIFPRLFAVLDQYEDARCQVIIKAPMREKQALEALSRHPVKYMFMPISYSLDDVREILVWTNINTVGIELISFTQQDELFSNESIRYVHDKNLLTWANAINLGDYNSKALFGGLDDDVSLLKSPDLGWGKLLQKNIDVIQTDWPALLYAYRNKQLGV